MLYPPSTNSNQFTWTISDYKGGVILNMYCDWSEDYPLRPCPLKTGSSQQHLQPRRCVWHHHEQPRDLDQYNRSVGRISHRLHGTRQVSPDFVVELMIIPNLRCPDSRLAQVPWKSSKQSFPPQKKTIDLYKETLEIVATSDISTSSQVYTTEDLVTLSRMLPCSPMPGEPGPWNRLSTNFCRWIFGVFPSDP